MFSVSFMITTKHNAQKIKRKESKHTTLENHQITKGESKRKEQRNYTTARKEDDNNKNPSQRIFVNMK